MVVSLPVLHSESATGTAAACRTAAVLLDWVLMTVVTGQRAGRHRLTQLLHLEHLSVHAAHCATPALPADTAVRHWQDLYVWRTVAESLDTHFNIQAACAARAPTCLPALGVVVGCNQL